MNRLLEAARRSLAVLLSSAILLLAPGSGAWQAAAQTVKAPVAAPVVGGSGAAAAGAAGRSTVGLAPASVQAGVTAPILPIVRDLGGARAGVSAQAAGLPAAAAPELAAPLALGAAAVPSPAAPSPLGAEPAVRSEVAAGEGALETGRVLGRATRIGAQTRALLRAFRVPRLVSDHLPELPGSRSLGDVNAGTRNLGEVQAGGTRNLRATRSPGGTPTLSTPAEGATGGGDDKQPPAPPQRGGNDGSGGSAFGLGKAALWFIGGLIIAQVGLEAWAAAWAKWIQTNFGQDQYAIITTVSMFVSLIAGYVGGWAADKFGVKRTYLAATIMGALGAAATLIAYQTGTLTFGVLVGLAAFRTFLASASRTAEQTIPMAIYKDNPSGLQRFNSLSQFILEIAGIAVPFSIGMMLVTFGSISTMWLLPVSAVLSVAVIAMLVQVPEFNAKKAAALRRANAVPVEKVEPDAGLLAIASWGYPAFMLLNMLLYSILAIGYGNFVHPGTTPLEEAAAAGLAGKIVSLYSVGGLLAALYLSGIARDLWVWLKGKVGSGLVPSLERRAARSGFFAGAARRALSVWSRVASWGAAGEVPSTPREARKENVRGAAFWTLAGIAGLVGFIPFLWTDPLLALVAMIPFGFTNVIGQLMLLSMIQENAPEGKRGKVMGGIRTVATLVATGAIYGFTQLFKHYPASPTPFWILLGILGAVGAYYLWVAARLKRHLPKL